jgi:peroxiredoxin
MITLFMMATALLAAPDFRLTDTEGNTVQLSKLRGQVVLVNFWSTTCAPCVQEMPWFSEFAREFRGRKFTVLGLAIEESWEPVRAFLRKSPVGYRVALSTDAVADQYKVDAMPTTLLLDRRGRVIWLHTGLVDRAHLRARIARAVAGR